MTTDTDEPDRYRFTNDWFGAARHVWANLVPRLNPTRILEVGSYEGASACFLIDTLARNKDIELHCIDTWRGGIEHGGADMERIEARFRYNTNLAMAKAAHDVQLVVHKGFSDFELSKLIASGKQGYFDFISIDGSHQAPDVLCDAVLCFRLLKVGGIIAFDDYIWSENLPNGTDPLRCPKPAIDAFTNLYCRKIEILKAPLYQLYVRKTGN